MPKQVAGSLLRYDIIEEVGKKHEDMKTNLYGDHSTLKKKSCVLVRRAMLIVNKCWSGMPEKGYELYFCYLQGGEVHGCASVCSLLLLRSNTNCRSWMFLR